MKSVPICENHLSQFYEAIKEGDLPLMEKLEHELTDDEKCVACSYILKTNGNIKEALKAYLETDSVSVETSVSCYFGNPVYSWGLRIFVFGGIFGAIYYLATQIQQLATGVKASTLFSMSITGDMIVVILSVLVFVFVEETFLR